ncbi:MAG: hypothetical protein IMZ55_10310 [Acidobacteria bacterium]|nr:hypothetical protein [Acidobacteriota bacterium]
MTRLTWKRRLQPFADMWEEMVRQLEDMETPDLRALEKACNQPSQTNCSWTIYGAAEFLRPKIVRELRRRGLAARTGDGAK